MIITLLDKNEFAKLAAEHNKQSYPFNAGIEIPNGNVSRILVIDGNAYLKLSPIADYNLSGVSKNVINERFIKEIEKFLRM